MHELLDWLAAIPKLNLAFIGIVVLIVIMLRRAQRSKHPYDVRDLLMTGDKASLNAHILAGMAILTAYYVLEIESDNHDNFLLGALGIFVLGRVGAQWITASNQPESGTTHTTETTNKKVESVQSAAPATNEAEAATPPRSRK